MRKSSKILTPSEQRAVVKELRADVRGLKAAASAAKKDLAAAQKEFMADPNHGESVKAYREAVSLHIKAAKEAAKLMKKLPA